MSEMERNEAQAAAVETAQPAGHIGTDVLFSAKDITKTFGGTQALKGVELEVHPGEIVGLVGENGAGKSTLLKIIIGAQPQTAGTMTLHGKPYAPKTPMDANREGVGMVFQEQSLIVTLNVAQNIFFGHEKDFKSGPVINWGRMNKEAAEVLADVDITDIPPHQEGQRPELRHPPDGGDRQGHERHQAVRHRSLPHPAGRAHLRTQRGRGGEPL